MSKQEKQHLKYLFSSIRPFLKEFFFLIMMLLIASVLSAIIPLVNRNLIDKGLLSNSLNKVVVYSALYVGLRRVIDVVRYAQFVLSNKVNNKFYYKLYYNAFKHLLCLEKDFLQKKNYNELLRQVEVDINNITSISSNYMIEVISILFQIIGGTIGLSIISWQLTLIVLLFVPLKFILASIFANKEKELMSKWIANESLLGSWLGDTLGGIEEIQLWNIQRFKLMELKALNRKIFVSKFNHSNANKLNQLFGQAIESIFQDAVVYIIGAGMIIRSELSLGSFFAFAMYSTAVITSISFLIDVKVEVASVMPSLERYINFFVKKRNEIKTEIEGIENKEKSCGDKLFEFDDVSYVVDGKPILSNINLSLYVGEKIAIVGHNGSGKSTLLNLLQKRIRPTTGNVFMNNINITTIQQKTYTELFSVMTQKSYLFNDSIYNNISMYKNLEKRKILESLRSVSAEKLIEDYDFLSYKVGNNGLLLSGGEHQKIALCRTLCKNSPILVLDEATSNFDANSEKELFLNLSERQEFDLMIIVTHNAELLKYVNRVIYLENGNIKREVINN